MTKRTARPAVLFFFSLTLLRADAGKLLLLIQDAQKQPVRGVEVGIEGGGGVTITGDDGKALLSLSSDTNENDWVSLQILHSPPGKDLALLSPFDGRALVPAFKNKAENFIRVIVVQRGDLVALQDGKVLRQLTETLNKADARRIASNPVTPQSSQTNLQAVAKQLGLSPADLEQAIQAWGARTNDPYEAGLAALHERNYSKATIDLQDSLKHREDRLLSDQDEVASAAYFLGQSLNGQQQYQNAVSAFERSLSVCRVSKNRRGEALALLGLAQANELLDQPENFKNASNYLTQAILLFQASSDKFNEAIAWWGLGTSNDRLGLTEQARDAYAKAMPFFSGTSDGDRYQGVLGRILVNLAEDEDAMGNVPKAVSYYERALPLLEAQHDGLTQGMALMRLGIIHEKQGDFAPAVTAYRSAAAVWHASGDKEGEATAELKLAFTLASTPDSKGALEAYASAAELSGALPNHSGQPAAYLGMARLYFGLRKYKESLESSLKASALLDGDPPKKATTLQMAGKSCLALHNNKPALAYFSKALSLGNGNPRSKAAVLVLTGEAYIDSGDPKSALDVEKQASDILDPAKDPALINSALVDVGQAYSALGMRPLAEASFEKARASARSRNDLPQQIAVLNAMASMHQGLGDHTQAASLYQESLVLIRQLDDRYEEAETLAKLGLVLQSLGDEQKAEDSSRQALAIERELSNRPGEAMALSRLGMLFRKRGIYEEAKSLTRQALQIDEEALGLDYPDTQSLQKSLQELTEESDRVVSRKTNPK